MNLIRTNPYQARNTAKAMLTQTLNRRLTAHEMAAVDFSRQCLICQELNMKLLNTCENCRAVFFCRVHDHEKLQIWHDPDNCEELRIHAEMVLVVGSCECRLVVRERGIAVLNNNVLQPNNR